MPEASVCFFFLPLLGTAAPAQLQASPKAGPDHAALICRFKVSGGDPVPPWRRRPCCAQRGGEQVGSRALAVHEAGTNICQAYAAIPLPGQGTGWPGQPHTCAVMWGSPPAHPSQGTHPVVGWPSRGPHGTARLCGVTSETTSAWFVRSASLHLMEPPAGLPGPAEVEQGLQHGLFLCCSSFTC